MAGLLLCVLGLVPDMALAARGDWREMSVGHFHLYSVLSDRKTRDIARELQAFESTVGDLLKSEDRLPDVPTLIYVLDRGDFERFVAEHAGVGGEFLERPYKNLIALNGDMDFDYVKVTVFHEYTHYIQRNSTTRQLPPWYVEGYAEVFSGFHFDGKQTITLGDLPQGVHIDPTRWIPVERLLDVKRTDPEYRAERLMPEFYGESWLLVHTLMLDDKTLATPTAHYLVNLDSGFPEPEAFKDSFPFDKAALNEMLLKALKRHVFHYIRMTRTSDIAIEDAPITRMAPRDATLALLRLAVYTRNEKGLAPLFEQALKEAPGDAHVLALQARVAANQGQAVDVGSLAASLAPDATDDLPLRIDLADALVAHAPTPEQARTALGLLNGVVSAESAPLEAIIVWANAAEAAGEPPEKVLPVLEHAAPRAPHNTSILRALALFSEAAGDRTRAKEYYNRIILVSPSPQERLWAQKQADLRLQ